MAVVHSAVKNKPVTARWANVTVWALAAAVLEGLEGAVAQAADLVALPAALVSVVPVKVAPVDPIKIDPAGLVQAVSRKAAPTAEKCPPVARSRVRATPAARQAGLSVR